MIIEKGKKKYLKIGERAIPFDGYDKNGKPVIKPRVLRTVHPNGRVDVKITIPSLKINYKKNA